MRLSVIIPTLNQANYLSATVARVPNPATQWPPHQIIAADWGSVDVPAELADELGARLVQRDPRVDSRAAALNKGAAVARGDVLLFLDADSTVPRSYDRAIETALRDPD